MTGDILKQGRYKMLRKLFVILMILTLPAAFIAAAKGWHVCGLSVAGSDGKVLFQAPVPYSFRFTTSYIHSVELTPVEDEYAVADGRIWPWQERVKSSNAGMPSLKPEHGLYISSAEWLIFQGGRTASERFFLRVGNAKFGRNKLKIPPFGEVSLFELIPGKRVAVEASRELFANSAVKESLGLLKK